MAKKILYFFSALTGYNMKWKSLFKLLNFLDDKYARILTSVPISNNVYGKNKNPNIVYKLLVGI